MAGRSCARRKVMTAERSEYSLGFYGCDIGKYKI